jgi:flagellar hook-length control protein FliK
MSSQIQSLSIKGGGEMRVRLKPENLGELNLRVIANGNHVGLQIQASDERAKKIIEESLGYLKESLSAQKLSLGQVDLTVVGSQQSQAPFKVGDAQGFGQESLPQNTNPNYSQGQSNQSYSGSSRSSENVPSSVNSMRGHSGVLGAQPLRTHWSGDKSRLDVMA